MEITTFQFLPYIPPEYMLTKTKLSWREIEWAYKHGMFGSFMFVELAKLKTQSEVLELELSKLDKDHLWRATEIIPELVKQEPDISENDILEKWLYIVLVYLYEHQAEFVDPLGKVEEVYEDFGHPKEVTPFVKYIPTQDTTYDPQKHSREENLQRLFGFWKEYLDRKEQKYGDQK